ncbi:unnamed protein product [Cercopithifilaria johnstoni]|uniref:Uncharacterized protein n=1 Tax=Cercopithifilaria johnstoni TaxID=2874296 RepID=A0A8J2Q326_9BILA|nr:unnamed protein product [Cercopithifilaria johnstoni]
MLPFLITKYFIALTIALFLSIVETNAQWVRLNILASNSQGGHRSLNDYTGGGLVPRGQLPAQKQDQATSSPLGPLSALLSLLGGSSIGGSFPYPYYPYYSGYGAYNPYMPSYYYYGGYPYYYYYYYYG